MLIALGLGIGFDEDALEYHQRNRHLDLAVCDEEPLIPVADSRERTEATVRSLLPASVPIRYGMVSPATFEPSGPDTNTTATTTIAMEWSVSDDATLSAFRLVDSFLPVGTHTVSYGLEQFIQGRIEEADDFKALLATHLRCQLSPADLVVLRTAHVAVTTGAWTVCTRPTDAGHGVP